MKLTSRNRSYFSCLFAFGLSACGGSQPPEPVAPPPPAPVVASASMPAAVAGAPAVVAPASSAPAAAPAAPAEAKHHGHKCSYPMAGMLFMQLQEVGLKSEQKTAAETIEADLDKTAEGAKEFKSQLANDIAEGVAAGKLTKAKVDADVKKLAETANKMAPAIQDALAKLHKTLDAAQRKKLIELLLAKVKEHQEHAMGPKGEHAEHGAGPHHEHGQGPMGAHGSMAGHGMDPGAVLEKLSTDLGLSTEQHDKLKAKLEANMKTEQAEMKIHHAAMEKHLKAMGDAFAGDAFDAKKIGVGEQAGAMAKMMATAQVRFVEAVLSVLKPEQRGKFADHVRQHAKSMEAGEHH